MSIVNLLPENKIGLLIIENEIEMAIDALRQYLEKYNFPELNDSLAIISVKWEDYENSRITGTVSFETLGEEKSRIVAGLLEINRSLFSQLKDVLIIDSPQGKKNKGIREDKFKNQILILLILSKLIIIGWVFFHVSTGGLENKQALAIITLILPVLSVYLGVIFDDILTDRYVSHKKRVYPYIKNSIRWTTYLLFGLYLIFTLNIIGNQAAGIYCDEFSITAGDVLQEINSDIAQKYCKGLQTLSKWMGLIETGLGAYIGKVVLSLFKNRK